MKRVAYVCADPGVPVFGTKGCSVHVQEVLRAMLARGWNVTLFAARLGAEPAPDLTKVPIVDLSTLAAPQAADREQALYARNPGIRTLVHGAGPFDLIYERYSIWSEAAITLASEMKIPGVLEVNAPLILEQQRHRGLNDIAKASAVLKMLIASASAVLAVSDEVRDYLLSEGADASTTHVVPNGVNVHRFQPVQISDRRPVVGFVGTMRPWHGLDQLIDAFLKVKQSVKDAALLLVGDGPELKRILERLAQAGVMDSVESTGAVSPEQMPALLSRMHVAVAPYPAGGFYFSPLKIFEYMAAGRAIVASRVGQISAVLEHNETALLCQPDDAEEMAHAISALLTDRSLADRLGRAARRAAENSHSWDQVITRIDSIAYPVAEVIA